MSLLERKHWSEEVIHSQEDEYLKRVVDEYGTKRWTTIAEKVSNKLSVTRTGKQCRERWLNHLDPNISDQKWSLVEQDKVFHLNNIYGNQWTKIAKLMPGRTENSIKNYFYSTVRKNIRRVNKLLVWPQKIQGSIKELKNNIELKSILFCNPKRCLRQAKKLKRSQIAKKSEENKKKNDLVDQDQYFDSDAWTLYQESYMNYLQMLWNGLPFIANSGILNTFNL